MSCNAFYSYYPPLLPLTPSRSISYLPCFWKQQFLWLGPWQWAGQLTSPISTSPMLELQACDTYLGIVFYLLVCLCSLLFTWVLMIQPSKHFTHWAVTFPTFLEANLQSSPLDGDRETRAAWCFKARATVSQVIVFFFFFFLLVAGVVFLFVWLHSCLPWAFQEFSGKVQHFPSPS